MTPALVVVLGAMAVSSVTFGLLRVLLWREKRYAARLDSEYRAYVIVEEAKREVRRG